MYYNVYVIIFDKVKEILLRYLWGLRRGRSGGNWRGVSFFNLLKS